MRHPRRHFALGNESRVAGVTAFVLCRCAAKLPKFSLIAGSIPCDKRTNPVLFNVFGNITSVTHFDIGIDFRRVREFRSAFSKKEKPKRKMFQNSTGCNSNRKLSSCAVAQEDSLFVKLAPATVAVRNKLLSFNQKSRFCCSTLKLAAIERAI